MKRYHSGLFAIIAVILMISLSGCLTTFLSDLSGDSDDIGASSPTTSTPAASAPESDQADQVDQVDQVDQAGDPSPSQPAEQPPVTDSAEQAPAADPAQPTAQDPQTQASGPAQPAQPSQPSQPAQPSGSGNQPQPPATGNDVVDRSVSGRDMFGYYVELNPSATTATFRAMEDLQPVLAVYDLEHFQWTEINQGFDRSRVDLTKLYSRTYKTAAQLDRVSSLVASRQLEEQRRQEEAAADVAAGQREYVYAFDHTIRDRLHLPDYFELAPNRQHEITIGVAEEARSWTINLRLGDPGDEDARLVSFSPSNGTRRTAVLSTAGYSNGDSVPFFYEVMIPGDNSIYAPGAKWGKAAFGMVMKNGGTPAELPIILEFEDPLPIVSRYLDLPEITAPISHTENTIRVGIKDMAASDWEVNFIFADAGSDQYSESVRLQRSGRSFQGTFVPDQNPGEQLIYKFSVYIPGIKGRATPYSDPVTLSGDRSLWRTEAELLSMMDIPPIRDYPRSSYEPSNSRYYDRSGSRPLLTMDPEIEYWDFMVYYRKAGTNEAWKEGLPERREVQPRWDGGKPHYQIYLPTDTYWDGDVIEYYFNIGITETGQYIDLLKDDPMSFRPSSQMPPSAATEATEIFKDLAAREIDMVVPGHTLFMGLNVVYAAHYDRRYTVELYYRNGSGSYQKESCRRSSHGDKYEFRLKADGFRVGTNMEYFYRITDPDGNVMHYGSESSPFTIRVVEEYPETEDPGA